MGADRGVGSRIFTGGGNVGDNWRQPARVRDGASLVKPLGAVNIDGITPIVNGDRVLFTTLAGAELADNNKVFRAVEAAGLVTAWNLDTDGQPAGLPQDGNIIYIKEGGTYGDKMYKWTGAGWSEVGAGGGAGANQQLSNLVANVTPNLPFLQVAGSGAAPAYSFAADTGTGLSQAGGAGTLSVSVSGSVRFSFNTSAFYATSNETHDIGTSTIRFNNVYSRFLNSRTSAGGGGLRLYDTAGSEKAGVRVSGSGASFILGGTSPLVGFQIFNNLVGATNDASLAIYTQTGATPGHIYIVGGYGNGAGAGANVELRSGNNTSTGNSGNIIVTAGTVVSGTRGTFNIDVLAIRSQDGTAAIPAYSFTSDPDTGMFSLAPNVLAFAVGGANKLAVSSTDINFSAVTTNYLAGTSVAKFWNTLGTFGVTLRGNAAQVADTTFQLPIDNGTNGYFLQTNGSGITSWAAVASGGPAWTKYTVAYTDLSIANTVNDIQLFSLVAKGIIHSVVLSHTTRFIGGAISAYTISVGVVGNLSKYASAFDVTQNTGDTVTQASSITDIENKTSATSIRVAANSVGANLSAATQGSIDIWVLTSTLP